MSYRYRLASVSKDIPEKVRNFSRRDLISFIKENSFSGYEVEEDYLAKYEILGQKEFYDLGSDFDYAKEIENIAKPLFSDENLQKETKILVCDENVFLLIIEKIRQKNVKYFQKLLTADEDTIRAHIKNKAEEWQTYSEIFEVEVKNDSLSNCLIPYNLNKDKDTLVNSWLWEYQIFELVRIYKSFDFSKNALLFYGW